MVIVIDNCSARTGGPDEANAWGVGSQLTGTLRRHSIRWVKDSGCGYGAEHGYVLKSHLAGAVLANTYTSMGSNTVQIGLKANIPHLSILFVIIVLFIGSNNFLMLNKINSTCRIPWKSSMQLYSATIATLLGIFYPAMQP